MEDFTSAWNELIKSGPLVIIMAIAVVVLWKHLVQKDKEYREEIKTLVANFSASLDKNTAALQENSKVMADHNVINKQLSENLYSNLVIKKQKESK